MPPRPRAPAGRLPELLVEVNVGDEAQKSGIPRAEADGFITACRDRFGAALRGLMCVPPQGEDPAPHFAWLADRAARHGLPVVSMGMSADFEIAIAHGATLVRVGTAIFGTRRQGVAALSRYPPRSACLSQRNRRMPRRRRPAGRSSRSAGTESA